MSADLRAVRDTELPTLSSVFDTIQWIESLPWAPGIKQIKRLETYHMDNGPFVGFHVERANVPGWAAALGLGDVREYEDNGITTASSWVTPEGMASHFITVTAYWTGTANGAA